jgi:hypothetical protein
MTVERDVLDSYLDDFGSRLAAVTVDSAATGSRGLRRRIGRRWVLALGAGSLALIGGGAAAATGLLQIAGGHTSKGAYTIERVPAGPRAAGPVCLELRYPGNPPAYGCGDRPSTAEPFGLVIADSVKASRERVIYGLVATDVARVSVIGDRPRHTDTTTVSKAGLPGRFFSLVVPNQGRIELVGYNASGRVNARIGSRAQPATQATSHDQAVAQGDPAGFAPAISMPSFFSYDGRKITQSDAVRQGLACTQDERRVQCYDSETALEAAHDRHRSGH